MKKILSYFLMFILLSTYATAQTTTSFEVDGIKVIFKPTQKESVSVRVYFKGGVANYPASQAGIERATLAGLFECGTNKHSADAYKDSCDKYHIIMGAKADYDYGTVSMLTISDYFDLGWDWFSEALLNPSFNGQDVQRLKDKLVASAKSSEGSPDAYLDKMEMKYGFVGTPYATDPDGDEQTIASFNSDSLRKYYNSVFNKKQMFFVIAGNLTKENIIQKIHASFANISSRPYMEVKYQPLVWQGNQIKTEHRRLATNYIGALMNAPQVNSPDYIPFRIAVSMLSGALFTNLRSKLSLSYDPGAAYVLLKMPFCEMNLSTTKPKEAIDAMMEQVNFVKNSRISEEYLNVIKNNFIVTKYLQEEAVGDITASLGRSEILGGWEYAEKLPEMLDSLTSKQIQDVFQKYVIGTKWVYLGN